MLSSRSSWSHHHARGAEITPSLKIARPVRPHFNWMLTGVLWANIDTILIGTSSLQRYAINQINAIKYYIGKKKDILRFRMHMNYLRMRKYWLLIVEFQSETFWGQVCLEMGIDLFTFPWRVRHQKYSRVQKQSNEMSEHSLCLNPEPALVISVMTICCDFHENFILYLENCIVSFVLRTIVIPSLNIDIVLIGAVVGFNCDYRKYQYNWIFFWVDCKKFAKCAEICL